MVMGGVCRKDDSGGTGVEKVHTATGEGLGGDGLCSSSSTTREGTLIFWPTGGDFSVFDLTLDLLLFGIFPAGKSNSLMTVSLFVIRTILRRNSPLRSSLISASLKTLESPGHDSR